MTDTFKNETKVTFTLNGKAVEAPAGENLIEACSNAGVDIPHFCYHNRMNPVGMCRMCIVEVDTGRGPGLQPSCMLNVSEGMSVDTESDVTKKAQDGILEFLLLNHPLDCPVCDKGGECPLQDQTIAYGPGETRFVEEKRHFEKPIPINDNVYLDRERCILCDRCTRFADEVVGDPLIHFIDRGNETQVNTFPEDPFASYFSGNVVQICPVGALTAKPYRFKARPWDLEEIESTYPNPLGDRIVIQSSRDEVLRFQGLDSEEVNWGWLTDKDRFSFQAFQSEYRIQEPLVRGSGLNKPDKSAEGLVASSWNTALDMTSKAIKATSPNRIAFIGGSRFTNESQYAWTKLAKGIIGTDNVDATLDDELPPEVLLGLQRATINEICSPESTILLIGSDLKEEYGTLYIRLRDAVTNMGAKLIELTPVETGLSNIATISIRPRPGEIAKVINSILTGESPVEIGGVHKDSIQACHELLKDNPIHVIFGHQSIAESTEPLTQALTLLNQVPGVKFLPLVRRGNTTGALHMGMVPGQLPGQIPLTTANKTDSNGWSNLPDEEGMTTTQILESAADGDIDVLFLLGTDPIGDYRNPELVQNALQRTETVIAVDLFVNPSVYQSDIIFPAASFIEINGSHTNTEGRITPVRQKVTSPGTARPDWMIAAEIAGRLDQDLEIEKPEDVWNEIQTINLDHQKITLQDIESSPEGVILEFGKETEFKEANLNIDTRPFDSYSHRLVLAKKMFDNGTIIQMSPSLKNFTNESEVLINPADYTATGITDGQLVTLINGEKKVNVVIRPDKKVPRSIAFAYLNQDGVDLRTLLTDGSESIDIRIDPTAKVI